MSKRKCIGILGGGQLARMSAYAAHQLGMDIAILEKIKDSPAGQLTHNEFVGWVDDDDIMTAFAEQSDIITLENEFVDAGRLKFLESLGKKVFPSSRTIGLIQDKFLQKKTLKKAGIPIPEFVEINASTTFEKLAEKLGLPFVMKSRKMGYDGYGNALVKTADDFEEGKKKLAARHENLMAEEYVDFALELAVMVARTRKEIKVYPVVESIQENHICKVVTAPSHIDKRYRNKAKEIGIAAVEAVKGYGIFGIEFFFTKDHKVLVNEMAPRPHNTGHYTIEGTRTSQFENHIRAVLNLPLGSTELTRPYAVMINTLGKRNGSGIITNYQEILADPDIHLHNYAKEISRVGRKMGHITVLGESLQKALKKARAAEKLVKI